uniref:Iron complex transport system permease protein n=1 Tax=Candidatus Kentrum sp. FW TaxID=2126338 RepID=A0A450SNQ4_9GAMM|nr:MAG: iron complex transport system permease protein [Candidatus Kentron sp. FW]
MSGLRAPALIDPRHLLWWLLTIALFAGAWGSLLIGYVDLPVTELLRGAFIEGDATLARIVFEIRLPRVLLAILVGGSLGIAGATLQGLLRNPLAEPGLLGASGGAALGAVLALYTGLADQFRMALPLSGFTGTAIAVVLVYLLAGTRTGTTALILAGVTISALTSALIALVLNFSPNPHAALEIIFWTLGSLTDRSNQEFFLILPPVAVGMSLMLASGAGLRALSLGEETAWSLGVNLIRLKVQVLVGCALAVGASVSRIFAGAPWIPSPVARKPECCWRGCWPESPVFCSPTSQSRIWIPPISRGYWDSCASLPDREWL